MSYEDRAPQVELIVDGRPVETKAFVSMLLGCTVQGIVQALRDVPPPERVRVVVSVSGPAEVEVNGARVPLNAFVTKYVCRTVIGMVSSLEGGEGAEEAELTIVYQ
jgi:hypothetical protein